MADISFAMQAKSDQMNAVDILGSEPVITIREVKVNHNAASQKVWVYFHGDNNRPWKPSVGMIRILAAGWGHESDNWLGKSVKLFVEPTVKYAGEEVGGIQIRAMSDIPTKGIRAVLTLNKKKRVPFNVDYLDMRRPAYPQDKFEQALPAMAQAMEEGKMTLNQVVARCQQTGDLTPDQLKQLEQAAPIDTNNDGEEIV